LYNASADAITLDLTQVTGTYNLKVQSTRNGSVLKEEKVNAGSILKINKVGNGDEVIVINKI
jgi:hypothetical protein